MYTYPNLTTFSLRTNYSPLFWRGVGGEAFSPLFGSGVGGEAFITPSLPPSQTSVHSPRRASSLLKYTP